MSVRTLKNFLLSLVRISDKKRWANIENHDENWSGRTEIMSKHVRPGESVFELGAGRCHLRDMLPASCSYTPSDIVERLPGTFVCDLNQKPLPVFPKHDVAVASGVLEYVHELPEVVTSLAASFDRLIVSYADTERYTSRRKRMRNGWFCNLSRRRFLEPFLAMGYELKAEAEWNRHGIYVFEKKRQS